MIKEDENETLFRNLALIPSIFIICSGIICIFLPVLIILYCMIALPILVTYIFGVLITRSYAKKSNFNYRNQFDYTIHGTALVFLIVLIIISVILAINFV